MWLSRGALILLVTLPAAAHEAHEHGSIASRWTPDFLVLTFLAVSALLYLGGYLRLRRRGAARSVSGWQLAAFATGWISIVIALLSPLDYLSEALFSAHMTQHEILMLVSAPLLVLGAPLTLMMHGLPAAARRRIISGARSGIIRTVWKKLTGPINVWILQAAVLLLWHIPALYNAALANEGIHFVQHVSFLAAAVLFFWALVHGRYGRMGYGLAVFYVFTTALYTSLFGALLTVSPRPWYSLHEARTRAWNVDAVADQQLAGLIMWIPAGAILMVVGLALFAAWMGALARRSAQVEDLEPEVKG